VELSLAGRIFRKTEKRVRARLAFRQFCVTLLAWRSVRERFLMAHFGRVDETRVMELADSFGSVFD